MAVFISHSFQNQPEFDNIADALKQRGIPYWNPNDIKSAASLRDQLRSAITHCNVCVFIVTKHALQSSWVGTELGAFWGAGKPVIVYLSDSSVQEDELPPIVRGDVWETRISRLVDRAAELVNQAMPIAGEVSDRGSMNVGAMTADQLQRLIVGAVSLAAATAGTNPGGTSPEGIGRAAQGAVDSVLEGIEAKNASPYSSDESWRNQLLWVDDFPANNLNERRAFESLGIEITLARSTQEALDILAGNKRFGVIISDMGRKEGPDEGYVLLDALRGSGDQTPFFIYAGSSTPEHKKMALHEGQGATNDARELFSMITRVLGRKDNV